MFTDFQLILLGNIVSMEVLIALKTHYTKLQSISNNRFDF